MNRSLTGSSICKVFQARIVAISSSGDLPDPGIEPTSPVSPKLQMDSTTEPLGKPLKYLFHITLTSCLWSTYTPLLLLLLLLFPLYSWGNWGKKFQFSSPAQLCPTICDPMVCSTPVFPVHHQLPELAQTHVHQVSDTIQPSHPLSSRSPPAFNLSQHQGLYQWVSSLHQVAKVLEFQLHCKKFR